MEKFINEIQLTIMMLAKYLLTAVLLVANAPAKSASLTPECFPIGPITTSRTEGQNINLRFVVDHIGSEYLSQEYFFNKQESVLYQAFEKAKEFLHEARENKTIKEDHSLRNFTIIYTTKEAYFQKLTQNDKFMEDLAAYVIHESSHPQAAQEVRPMLEDSLEEILGKAHPDNVGAAWRCLGKAYVFIDYFKVGKYGLTPIDQIALVTAHEIGHLIGFEHTSTNPNNFMGPVGINRGLSDSSKDSKQKRTLASTHIDCVLE
jgi:hypothetical protein